MYTHPEVGATICRCFAQRSLGLAGVQARKASLSSKAEEPRRRLTGQEQPMYDLLIACADSQSVYARHCRMSASVTTGHIQRWEPGPELPPSCSYVQTAHRTFLSRNRRPAFVSGIIVAITSYTQGSHRDAANVVRLHDGYPSAMSHKPYDRRNSPDFATRRGAESSSSSHRAPRQ